MKSVSPDTHSPEDFDFSHPEPKASTLAVLTIALVLLAVLGGISLKKSTSSSSSAPTMTLRPASSSLSESSKSDPEKAAALLPAPAALAQQLATAIPGSSTVFVSERALSEEEAPSPALSGWRRTWEISLDGKTASLTLSAIAYRAPTAATIQRETLLEIQNVPSPSDPGVQTFESDGSFYAVAASPADSQTASALFVVVMKGSSSQESAVPLVGYIASSLSSSLNPTWRPS